MSGSVDEGEIDSKCKELSLSTTECEYFKKSKNSKNEMYGTSLNHSFNSLLVKLENTLYCTKYENEKFYYYLIKGLVFANLNQQKTENY